MKRNNALSPVSANLCLGIILAAVMFLAACKHDPLRPGPGTQGQITDTIPQDTIPTDTTNTDTTSLVHPCDSDTVYFERDLLPILVSNCALSGCHDANTAQDGVVLTSYEKVVQTGDVEPFDLDDSDLYEVITDSDPDKRMPPPPNAPLPDSLITMIRTWITQGAQSLTCDESELCDTVAVSFSQDVQPILNTSCTGCHNSNNASGGISLTNYTGVLGPATSGQLYGAVAHQPGSVAMPQGGNKLPDCQINTIKAWIDQGIKDN